MGLSFEYDFVHLSVPYDEESAEVWPPERDTIQQIVNRHIAYKSK